MTQPTSVDMTFDTSLVDLKDSFSTTESDPSDAGTAHAAPTSSTVSLQTPTLPPQNPTPSHQPSHSSLPKPHTPVQHVSTHTAYEQWATVYDTDGNMLQSIDDAELTTLLPPFLAQILSRAPAGPINLLDLGCGTGRNTAKLVSYDWPQDVVVHITALDFSPSMLSVGRAKIAALLQQPNKSNITVRFEAADCFPTASSPIASPTPDIPGLPPTGFTAALSTLVLEHIPLTPFFATLSSLLASSGIALLTNMHPNMGAVSQAGFVNDAGVKVRGESFAHGVAETVDKATESGLVVEGVWERGVEERDVERGVVGERGRKWVGVEVWYGVLLRKGA